MAWLVIEERNGVHIAPEGDLVQHEPEDCICGPRWEFVDQKTGEAYEDPVIVHMALDGRP